MAPAMSGAAFHEGDRKAPWVLILVVALVVMPFVSIFGAILVFRSWPAGNELDLALFNLSASSDSASLAMLTGNKDYCGPKERFFNEPYQIMGPVTWSEVPKKMKSEYTLGGQVRVIEAYFKVNESAPHPPPAHPNGFNESYIQHLVAVVKSGRNVCHYKCSSKFYNAFKEFPIKGKSVVILGSMLPWAEAHCLAAEAALVTTVDYNDPHFEHPGLRFWYPHHLSRTEELFDAAISYSSFEHDGLGRYGDPLHPTADLLRMQQLRKILKPDGRLYMGVPVGNDTVVFNWHRIYGPIRFPLLTQGWKLLKTFGEPEVKSLSETWRTNTIAMYHLQPLHVLSIDNDWKPPSNPAEPAV